MNEYITALASIDFISLISAIVIIMVALVALKEIAEKFCNILGIEFSWIKNKHENQERQQEIKEDLEMLSIRQAKLEEFNKTIIDSINSLKNEITTLADHIEKREIEKRFKKLRYDILNFANLLSSKSVVSAELINQVYKEISEYEELSEKYHLKNNQVNASVAVISAKYQEMLLNGQIKKED